MHFSKTYAEAAKDLPAEWLPYLISYKALKKCISQIVKELEGRGLPVDLLKELSQKQEELRTTEGTSLSESATHTSELPPTSDTGSTSLQLGQASIFQQVIHSGSQHKVLYTFADSSHPCLLLIVNEGAEKELFSTENSPGSTAPSSPVMIPDAPHFATRRLATDTSDDESTRGADNKLMQRLTALTLDDITTVDSGLENKSTGIPPMIEEYHMLRAEEEEEEEDPEEDLRHEQREQEEMDRHFSSRDQRSNPKLIFYAATTSRPPSATPSTVSLQRPISELLSPMTPTTLINGDSSPSDLSVQTLDERDAKTFEELAASAALAESAKRKQRRRTRRSFATVYADDGQAVRIARFEDQNFEKGLKSQDSRHPIIELESKTSPNLDNIENCPCALANQGQIDEHGNRVRTVKVTLSTDVNFFNTILSAIAKLADFQSTIKTVYHQKIRRVGDLVASAATPHSSTFGFHKSSDLYAWREIMATFAEEEIWFDESRTEMRGDSANLEKCKARLDKWETKALQQCYPKLRSEKSKIAFEEFLKLNRDILAMKQFRELNKMAIGKILKKHDKRTMLISRSGFETLIATNTFISESLIHALSYSIANQLMTIIPQPRDYSCPVCLSISWKPIRLNCGHIFCLRCLIKAQRRKMTNCPLCRRSGSVEQANAGNLDVPLMNLMKLYFPKEIKEKRRDNAREVVEYEGY